MLKKFLSVMMAGAMILALAVPAFATENLTTNVWNAADGSNATDPEASKIEVTAALKTPTLKIAVGNGAGVVFNPAQMKVTTSSTFTPGIMNGAGTLPTTTQDQIIASETTIQNFSNVPVRMYAKAVATEGVDNIEFTNDSIDDTETGKKLHLFCEVIRGGEDSPKLTGDDDTNDYTSYYVTQTEDDEGIQSRQGWDGRKNQIAVSTDTRDDYDSEDNYVMIFEENSNALAENLPTSISNQAATGKMKFFGSMTKNPTVPWGNDDQVKFTLTMKFAMMTNEVEEE